MTAFGGPPTLFTIDPVTGVYAPLFLFPPLGNLNAVAVEKVTGDLALATSQVSPYPWSVLRRTSAGAATLLASPPAGGWGAFAGIAVNPNPETYGPGTAGSTAYSWSLCPNAGGLPTVGDAGFRLTLATNSPSAAGILAASLGAADLPNFGGLGLTLLVDPAQVLFVGLHGGTIPLPIPNDPTLASVAHVYFQSFHLDAGAPMGIAATKGVEVTVL